MLECVEGNVTFQFTQRGLDDEPDGIGRASTS